MILLRTVYVTQLILLFITQSSQVHALLMHEKKEEEENENDTEKRIEDKSQGIRVRWYLYVS